MSYLNLTSAESIISTICLFFAYCISVTCTGAGQTAIARAMGDHTAEEEGYLSLNPFDHVDFIGALCLLLFRFGWGRQIPINPLFIKHPWHNLRLIFTYSSEALLSLLLALTSLLLFLPILDPSSFTMAIQMIVSGQTSTRSLFTLFPDIAVWKVLLTLFLLSMVFINTFIATYSILSNGIKYIIARGQIKGHDYMEYADYIMLFGPLLFLFFFAEPLRILLIRVTLISAYYLGLLFGAF